MYPTKEEILQKPVKLRESTLEAVRIWKAAHYRGWRNLDRGAKITLLKVLLKNLSDVYDRPLVTQTGDHYAYYPDFQMIELDGNHPSIVSTLHEFAHHLYGPSELRACRWSVWLFKRCFPKDFTRLSWDGHQLVQ